jgi:hypothetical protein
MNIGLSGPLDFDSDRIIKSCILYWGEYNKNYPLDANGHEVKERNQLEFTDIAVKDLQWVIDTMRKQMN